MNNYFKNSDSDEKSCDIGGFLAVISRPHWRAGSQLSSPAEMRREPRFTCTPNQDRGSAFSGHLWPYSGKDGYGPNPIHGKRSYGSRPEEVASRGNQCVTGDLPKGYGVLLPQSAPYGSLPGNRCDDGLSAAPAASNLLSVPARKGELCADLAPTNNERPSQMLRAMLTTEENQAKRTRHVVVVTVP